MDDEQPAPTTKGVATELLTALDRGPEIAGPAGRE